MSKLVPRLLQALSTAVFINIFIFDKRNRIFRCRPKLRRFTRILYKIIFLPLLTMTGFVFAVISVFIYTANEENFQGKEGFMSTSCIGVSIIVVKKIIVLVVICVVHGFSFRLARIQRLLNNFVSIYDQYLLLIGHPLRLNWTAFVLMTMKLLFSEMLIICLTHNVVGRLGYFFLALQPLVLSIVMLWGLIFLHALFHGAHSAVHNPKSAKIEELLLFYNDLLKLRSDFEAYSMLIVSLELVLDAVFLISAILMVYNIIPIFAGVLLGPLFLLYPMLVAFLSHDICNIHERLGNDLLQFCFGELSIANDKLVELFSIQKRFIYKDTNLFFGILHLRRGFIVIFFDFAWVNAMFMHSIYTTSKDVNTDVHQI